MNRLAVAAVILSAAVLGIALVVAVLDLPPTAVSLPTAVAERLGQSGVSHPVTAVLLNFRGYDTLLEVAVLLLALLGLLAVAGERASPEIGGVQAPVTRALARFVTPFVILAAGYLLWAGAHRPGGAFQAGAVLAAGAVLLNLAHLLPAWTAPRLWLRLGLGGGFLVFLAIAAALLTEGALLQYPPAWAGALILGVEAGLTLSLGLVLAGLFLFLTEPRARQ